MTSAADRLRYQRAAAAFDAPLQDGVMVLNSASGALHALDSVGAAVWEQLAEPCTLTELIRGLCASFAVTPEACRQDVTPFLEALRVRGLVTVAHSAEVDLSNP